MTQPVTLHYLFDPLCGWCYGASATIKILSKHPDIDLHPQATGLFTGNGARPMKSFAAQAWANDQRIAAMSGQPFSEAYRRDVLGAADASLDSTLATLAVTAVADSSPDRVIEALTALQAARYADGIDVTDVAAVAAVLTQHDFAEAAARVLHPDAPLQSLVRSRTDAARTLMAAYHIQGVPALIAEIGGEGRVLHSATLYAGPEAILAAIRLA